MMATRLTTLKSKRLAHGIADSGLADRQAVMQDVFDHLDSTNQR